MSEARATDVIAVATAADWPEIVALLTVPAEIRSTKQFSGLCPCCAICMGKKL